MVFDRPIRITLLGNTGVGKTSLVKLLKGEDPVHTEKTMDISVETRRIKLLSSLEKSRFTIERHRYYRITCVDNPGDYKLRRKWREAMRKFRADGILFMVDPSQSVEQQKVAMEDSYNYFLDSLSLNPDRADKKARSKRGIFFFVVNKLDLINNDKEAAERFLTENFSQIIDDYKMTFPFSYFGYAHISVHKSEYEEIDSIFEQMKIFLYDN